MNDVVEKFVCTLECCSTDSIGIAQCFVSHVDSEHMIHWLSSIGKCIGQHTLHRHILAEKKIIQARTIFPLDWHICVSTWDMNVSMRNFAHVSRIFRSSSSTFIHPTKQNTPLNWKLHQYFPFKFYFHTKVICHSKHVKHLYMDVCACACLRLMTTLLDPWAKLAALQLLLVNCRPKPPSCVFAEYFWENRWCRSSISVCTQRQLLYISSASKVE